MLYPLKFKPVYKEIIWGGRHLERFGKVIEEGKKVAESWELCAREDGQSIVLNGELKGKSLQSLMDEYKRTLIGTKLEDRDVEKFPLFVKLIDANDRLSVQVHPDDKYAKEHENGAYGKDETWVVLYSEPGAKLVYDLKSDVSKEVFKRALYDGTCEDYLNFVEVKPGDVFNIYPGLVHAIGKGIVVAEIQQNSNTTYRVYDYNRKDKEGNTRELHIDKALDVIQFKKKYPFTSIPGLSITLDEDSKKTLFVSNKYYEIWKYDILGKAFEEADGDRFYIYSVSDGEGEIVYDKDKKELVKKGDTILIPATLGKYEIRGNLQLIKACVPRSKSELIEELEKENIDMNKIENMIAL